MLKRIVTGAVLIPIVVLAVYWAPSWVVAIVAAAVALLATMEFFKLTAQMGLRAFRKWTMVCIVGLFGVQWLLGITEVRWMGPNTEVIRGLAGNYESPEVILLLFVLGCACIGVMSRVPIADVLPAIGASAAGLIFVALPFSYLVRLDGQETRGSTLVLFTLAIVWAGDTLAYFVGKFLGRTKMAPALSPKKTWEGAAGNLFGSLVVGYCFARGLRFDPLPWLVTATLANIAGQVGDLVESAYKRGAGVKDSGALLPGHGGMLDRIDSLILAAPVVWLAAGWLLQGRQ
jgi:phosphatidate cytidylyltransferase